MSAEKPAKPKKKNKVQIALPKSLASMTDEEIMQWAKGLYKSVVEQLAPPVDEQVTVDTDKNLLARARRYGLITEAPEQTRAGADDYLRDDAREYGLDPNNQAVIEQLRLYL